MSDEDKKPKAGNASAESVTGAQDVITETNGEAHLPKGIVPEATADVHVDQNPAESSILPKDPDTQPTDTGDSSEQKPA